MNRTGEQPVEEESICQARVGAPADRPLDALPFSCPLAAAKAGKGRQSPAYGETEKSLDSSGADARSGKAQQRPAKRG
jgi:hypothetical protein